MDLRKLDISRNVGTELEWRRDAVPAYGVWKIASEFDRGFKVILAVLTSRFPGASPTPDTGSRPTASMPPVRLPRSRRSLSRRVSRRAFHGAHDGESLPDPV